MAWQSGVLGSHYDGLVFEDKKPDFVSYSVFPNHFKQVNA
jgi:hypothetical protein